MRGSERKPVRSVVMVYVQGQDWPWQIGAVPGAGPSNDKMESMRREGFHLVMSYRVQRMQPASNDSRWLDER